MSIINEALKKVQSDLNQKGNPHNSMTPQPPNPPENNLPPQQPLPNYDPTLGQPKAPWDIPMAAPTPPQQASHSPEKKTNSPPQSAAPKKANNSIGRSIILLIVFFTLIFATLHFVKKNEHLLAEHDIHLRLPDFSNLLPKNILSRSTVPATAATASPIKPANPNALTVSAVMQNGGKYAAIINDKVYAVGDSVNGMKILRISFQEVVVQDGTVEKTIEVNLR